MILNENFTITDLMQNYTDDEIDEACEALKNEYTSDKHFLHDFINFNSSEMLEYKINNFLGKELTHEYIADMPQEEIDELFDSFFWNMCEQIDMKFISEYLKYNFDYKTEDDLEENINISKLYQATAETVDAIDNIQDKEYDSAKSNLKSAETKIVDVENDLDKNESLTEAVDDDIDVEEVDLDVDDEEIENDDETTKINETVKKQIQFPVLISATKNLEPIELEQDVKDELIDEYSTAVVDNMNENKKFILSALNIYDFEIFYNSYDTNNNITFDLIFDTDVSNDQLINVLKRYFNADIIDNTDEIDISLNPVLDNKFIKFT